MFVFPLLALSACVDYGLERSLGEPPEAPPVPPFDLAPPPPEPKPAIEVDPLYYDFGSTDPWVPIAEPITITNVGRKILTVSDLAYTSTTNEFTFSDMATDYGDLPWTLAPGESRDVVVTYAAVDQTSDQGTLSVSSDDPQQPVVDAVQVGTGQPFAGFSTGWYIVNDDTPYDLTTDPNHVVDYNGDSDAYWYEPSGVHGMTGSTDPAADFAYLHDYIIGRAGGPTPVTGPLSFHAASTLTQMQQGSFSYILCDFWLDPGEDPSQYTISSGTVDDGIRVIVNGTILGELTYNQTGVWGLSGAIPGAVNTLVVILEDNARIEKYINDLAFYKNGVMVGG